MNRMTSFAAACAIGALGLVVGCDDSKTSTPTTTSPPATKTEDMKSPESTMKSDAAAAGEKM